MNVIELWSRVLLADGVKRLSKPAKLK